MNSFIDKQNSNFTNNTLSKSKTLNCSKQSTKIKSQNIRIFHQNIEHLPSRLDSLKIVIDELDPDICVITEHNMKTQEMDRINFSCYSTLSYYCRETSKKGGVVIFCKNTLSHVKILNLPSAERLREDKIFEFCAVQCNVHSFKFILVGLYRSPSSNVYEFLERLNTLIEILLIKCNYILFVGDLNINVLVQSKEHDEFKNILNRNGFFYFVNFPTRVTTNSQSAIDNVFSSINRDKVQVEGVITMLSDHDGQLINLINLGNRNNNRKQKTELKRDYCSANMETFLSLLDKESWFEVFLANSNNKYETFFNIFKYYFDMSFNIKRVKLGQKKNEWLTDELKNERCDIIRELKIARMEKNKLLHCRVKIKHKLYKSKILKIKKDYYENKIKNSKNLTKATWSMINSEVGNKNICLEKDLTVRFKGKLYSDPQVVSNIFCDYFSNIVSDLKGGVNNSQFLNYSAHGKTLFQKRFSLTPTNEQEIENIIGLLKQKNSVGFDEIPISVLKAAKNHISKVLSHLINSSFISGLYPNLLKISKIVPVYKKGCKLELANYRPISLQSNISKIYEKVVYSRLIQYLEENCLIDKVQHGFRSNRSVTTASIQLVESIIDSIDNGEETIGIFMDLTKAFDSVNHSLLLLKLHNLGVTGVPLEFFKSYLLDRKQNVVVKKTFRNTKCD